MGCEMKNEYIKENRKINSIFIPNQEYLLSVLYFL